MIEFNKVTWYSRLGALVLFIGVIPAVAFYLGMQYEAVMEESTTLPQLVVKTAPEKPIATATYVCDGGKSITAAFYEGAKAPQPKPGEPPTPTGSVVVSFGEITNLKLMQTLSASGARYANSDESLVFWNKGDTALIMRNNAMDLTYKNCVAK